MTAICFIIACFHFSFSQNTEENYHRFIDSASIYLDDHYKKALTFLDSIPPPFEKTIDGRLAEYYSFKALIHDGDHEYAKQYQSYILALKYAEKERNYELAAEASLELFANVYYFKKDTTAFRYLENAKTYYEQSGEHAVGFMKINQAYAYAKFMDGDYEACNALILEHIDDYKNLKEDAYYYMFATYMLTSNYIYLGNFKKAYHYFKKFKSLENNPTIVKYNYFSFKSTIDACFADVYFEKKQMDSTFHYINEMAELRSYMIADVTEYYYRLNADVYKLSGNIDESKKYIDSLLHFEDQVFGSLVDASHQMNNSLLNAESEIKAENKKKLFNGILAGVLFSIMVSVSVFYVIDYRKHKLKLQKLIRRYCTSRFNLLS